MKKKRNIETKNQNKARKTNSLTSKTNNVPTSKNQLSSDKNDINHSNHAIFSNINNLSNVEFNINKEKNNLTSSTYPTLQSSASIGKVNNTPNIHTNYNQLPYNNNNINKQAYSPHSQIIPSNNYVSINSHSNNSGNNIGNIAHNLPGHNSVISNHDQLNNTYKVNNQNAKILLSQAVSTGNQIMVKKLLDQGFNVDIKNDNEWTLLHTAAYKGYTEIVKILLGSGANVTAKTNFGWTPLYKAIEAGHLEIVKLLLLNKFTKIEDIDNTGYTALHIACICGQAAVVQLLLANGASVTAKNNSEWTPLHEAAYRGYTEITKILLSSGASVTAKTDFGWTPLHKAAEAGHIEVAYCLLNSGADAKAVTSAGKTPLEIVFEYCHKYNNTEEYRIGEFVQLLLNYQAKVNDVFKSIVPTHNSNNNNLVNDKLLNDQNSAASRLKSVDQRNENIANELCVTSYNSIDSNSINQVSLQQNENTNAITKELSLVATSDITASNTITDNIQNSATSKFVEKSYKKMVARVKKISKDNINATDEQGDTFLHQTVRNKANMATYILLSKGASIDIANNAGETARDLMREIYSKGIAEGKDGCGIFQVSSDPKAHKFLRNFLIKEKINVNDPADSSKIVKKVSAVALMQLAKEISKDNINATDKQGDTFLHQTVRNKANMATYILLSKGASIDIANNAGETARDLMREIYSKGIAEGKRVHSIFRVGSDSEANKFLRNFLVKEKINVNDSADSSKIVKKVSAVALMQLAKEISKDNINATDKQGDTLLHQTVRNKANTATYILLLKGASIDIANNAGETARDLMREICIEGIEKGKALKTIFQVCSDPKASKFLHNFLKKNITGLVGKKRKFSELDDGDQDNLEQDENTDAVTEELSSADTNITTSNIITDDIQNSAASSRVESVDQRNENIAQEIKDLRNNSSEFQELLKENEKGRENSTDEQGDTALHNSLKQNDVTKSNIQSNFSGKANDMAVINTSKSLGDLQKTNNNLSRNNNENIDHYETYNNAFNKKSEILYRYEYRDVELIGKMLIEEFNNNNTSDQRVIYASPFVIGKDLQGLEFDIARAWRDYKDDLKVGKKVVGVFNANGNHWIAYLLILDPKDDMIKCIYKDSLGNKQANFEQAFIKAFYGQDITENYAKQLIVTQVNKCEQILDFEPEQNNIHIHTNCAIFALNNVVILAKIAVNYIKIVKFEITLFGSNTIPNINNYIEQKKFFSLGSNLIDYNQNSQKFREDWGNIYSYAIIKENIEGVIARINTLNHCNEAEFLADILGIKNQFVEICSVKNQLKEYLYKIKYSAIEQQMRNILNTKNIAFEDDKISKILLIKPIDIMNWLDSFDYMSNYKCIELKNLINKNSAIDLVIDNDTRQQIVLTVSKQLGLETNQVQNLQDVHNLVECYINQTKNSNVQLNNNQSLESSDTVEVDQEIFNINIQSDNPIETNEEANSRNVSPLENFDDVGKTGKNSCDATTKQATNSSQDNGSVFDQSMSFRPLADHPTIIQDSSCILNNNQSININSTNEFINIKSLSNIFSQCTNQDNEYQNSTDPLVLASIEQRNVNKPNQHIDILNHSSFESGNINSNNSNSNTLIIIEDDTTCDDNSNQNSAITQEFTRQNIPTSNSNSNLTQHIDATTQTQDFFNIFKNYNQCLSELSTNNKDDYSIPLIIIEDDAPM